MKGLLANYEEAAAVMGVKRKKIDYLLTDMKSLIFGIHCHIQYKCLIILIRYRPCTSHQTFVYVCKSKMSAVIKSLFCSIDITFGTAERFN